MRPPLPRLNRRHGPVAASVVREGPLGVWAHLTPLSFLPGCAWVCLGKVPSACCLTAFLRRAQLLADVPVGSQCLGLVKPSRSERLVLPTLVLSVAVASGAVVYLAWPLLAALLGIPTGGRSGRRKSGKSNWAGGMLSTD